MDYPTLIFTDNGHEAIARGHGLSPEMITDVQRAIIGDPEEGRFTEVEEVYFEYHPRVKWCERLTGWSCDQEGDWHGHWLAVQPNDHPHTHFTLIRHSRAYPIDALKGGDDE